MDYYYAYIRKDDDSDFGVDFPDFPGCVSAGATADDAIAAAEEALALHVSGLTAAGLPLPGPSDLGLLHADADDDVRMVARIPLRPVKGKPQRVQITLDEFLLKEIDAAARSGGFTRSGFLADAARRHLG